MFRNSERGCDQSGSPSEASVGQTWGWGTEDPQTPVGRLIQLTALVWQEVMGTLHTWPVEIKVRCMFSAVGS